MPELGGSTTKVRDERAKWVRALLAQERAMSPRVCVTV
jgi:hypothetical protein